MRTLGHWLRTIASWGLIGFGFAGSLFVLGYAYEDMGHWRGIAISLIWLVPLFLSIWLANWRHESAWLLMRAYALLAVVGAVVMYFWPTQWATVMDNSGPIFSIYLLVAITSLGFWSRHKPHRAGWLLMVVGGVPLLSDVLAKQSMNRLPGGSSLELVCLAAVAAALLLEAAARIEHVRE